MSTATIPRRTTVEDQTRPTSWIDVFSNRRESKLVAAAAVPYEYVPGFFAQDDPLVDAETLGSVPPRFGLLDASDTRWSNLNAKLRELNEQDAAVPYKLFFFGGHGEGYHKVGREKYGWVAGVGYLGPYPKFKSLITEIFRHRRAMLNGDVEITWGCKNVREWHSKFTFEKRTYIQTKAALQQRTNNGYRMCGRRKIMPPRARRPFLIGFSLRITMLLGHILLTARMHINIAIVTPVDGSYTFIISSIHSWSGRYAKF
ncbi:hypothetical protein C8R43DRAFT_949870 [Mycena crocata]|nr:hypothetical protein C8R43DRAFT_949870 [Mycena crocata]